MNEARTGLVTATEFTPRSLEDFAMQKVIDPIEEAEKFVLHGMYGNQLRNILHQGVYTEDFAKRIGDTSFVRNGGSDYNERFISVAESHETLFLRWFAVMMPSEKVYKNKKGYGGERLIHLRARQRDFMGLQIKMGAMDVDYVLSIAGEIWRENPQNSLPMYDARDKSLIWPRI